MPACGPSFHVRLSVPPSVPQTMRPSAFLSRRTVTCTAPILAAMLLAGCAAAGNQNSPTPSLLDKLLATPTPAPEPPPPAAKVESCGTPAQCRTALKKLVDSPKRGWVGQPQPPAAYTDGTRLFAYRALRTKLNCRELTASLAEVRTVSKSLSGEMPDVSADQVSRTRALSGKVESELAKERGVRCKG